MINVMVVFLVVFMAGSVVLFFSTFTRVFAALTREYRLKRPVLCLVAPLFASSLFSSAYGIIRTEVWIVMCPTFKIAAAISAFLVIIFVWHDYSHLEKRIAAQKEARK